MPSVLCDPLYFPSNPPSLGSTGDNTNNIDNTGGFVNDLTDNDNTDSSDNIINNDHSNSSSFNFQKLIILVVQTVIFIFKMK